MQDLRVEVEESVSLPRAAATPSLAEPGFVEFAVAGTSVAGEFRCADCGYGAVVQRVLPSCPMCAGTVWESRGPLGSRLVG